MMQVTTGNHPLHAILDGVLTRSELKALQSLAQGEGVRLDEHRYRLVEKQFTIEMLDERLRAVGKVASLFLETLRGMDVDFKSASFDFSIDRSLVNAGEVRAPLLGWHQDEMRLVNGEVVTPQFTMALLISRKEGSWEGGDLELQEGGYYVDHQGRRAEWCGERWKNSRRPIHRIETRYNRAVVFQNEGVGHRVTSVIPKVNAVRDVFLISVFLD